MNDFILVLQGMAHCFIIYSISTNDDHPISAETEKFVIALSSHIRGIFITVHKSQPQSAFDKNCLPGPNPIKNLIAFAYAAQNVTCLQRLRGLLGP